MESRLLERISSRKAALTFLGLGHVGLPTAVAFSRAGFQVTGVDADSQRVRDIALGKCDIGEPGLDEARIEAAGLTYLGVGYGIHKGRVS